MSNGEDIAAQIASALSEASEALGDGELIARIATPGDSTGPSWAPSGESQGLVRDVRCVIDSFDEREIDGTSIRFGDKRIIIEAIEPAPTPSDSIIVAGIIYAIINVETTNPGGVNLMHEIQSRRSGDAPIFVDDYDQSQSAPAAA